MPAPALADRLPPAERHEWLEAEASTRRFARLVRPTGGWAPTAVAMIFSSRTPPAEVERVAASTRQLAQAGVPVPELYAVDAERRLIVQEDVGDVALAEAKAAGVDLRAAYAEALSILTKIESAQVDTSPRPPLDAVRMKRELELFASGAVPGAGPELGRDLAVVAETCADLPTVLCHRDYHARNLFVHDGRVRVIDHQDAMAGPAPYDRVSLAYDPYVELADATRDVIAATARTGLAGGEPESEGPSADEAVAWVAVQRLAKAIGTFTYKGGKWSASIRPAARQARRLIATHGLPLAVLDMALAPLALGVGVAVSAPIRQAAVLCAGEGRRLRPFTERIPKPLLPLLGAPLVEHVAWSLARAGVERIVVNAWWRAERIADWAASDPVPGVPIEVVREPVLAGTGGGLVGLAERLDDGPLFVATADVVGDVDWQALAEHHRRVGAVATMTLATRGDVERYGRVTASHDGRLTDVVGLVDERAAQAPGARVAVNASWHVVEPEFVARLPARPPSCLVRDGYVAALGAGEPVGAFVHDGAWAEVGTPDLLVAAHVAALTDALPLDGDLAARAGRHVDTLSRVADGATVGRGARLVRTVVGTRATIGDGAVLRDCVVMAGASVSSGSEHVGELIGSHGVDR